MNNPKKIASMFLLILLVIVLLPNNVQAAKTKLSKTKITIQNGNTYSLNLQNNTNAIKWTSNNKKIATVSNEGLVTGKKVGSCTVTAKVGKKKYSCKVTIKESDLEHFFHDEIILTKGNKISQTFIYNNNYFSTNIKWSSSDKNIATISSKGVISGKSAGKVTITAKYKNKKYKFDMIVVDKIIFYDDEKINIAVNNISNSRGFSQKTSRMALTIKNKTNNSFAFFFDNIGINGKQVSDLDYSINIPANTESTYLKTFYDIDTYDISYMSGIIKLYNDNSYTMENIDFSNIRIK